MSFGVSWLKLSTGKIRLKNLFLFTESYKCWRYLFQEGLKDLLSKFPYHIGKSCSFIQEMN